MQNTHRQDHFHGNGPALFKILSQLSLLIKNMTAYTQCEMLKSKFIINRFINTDNLCRFQSDRVCIHSDWLVDPIHILDLKKTHFPLLCNISILG